MDNSYLDNVAQKRLDKEEAVQKQKLHQEVVNATVKSSKSVVDAITKQHELDRTLAKQKKQVDVQNFPDIALREDIQRLVNAVNTLKDENKPEKIEWEPVVSALNTLGAKLDAIPQALPEMPEMPENVTIKNIGDIRNAIKPLIDAVNSKNYEPVFKPRIEVQSPNVKVDVPEVDLTSLKTSINDLGNLLSESLSANFIDIQPILEATSKTTQAIQSLKFPVPNYILPFKDINGKAVQIQLDSSGNLPTTTGSTLYKTLIDKTTTTNVVYVGKAPIGTATSSNAWLITKIDKSSSPISITYADAGAFTAVWNDRVSEVYS